MKPNLSMEELQALAFVPGLWICPTCNYTHKMSTLHALDGGISPDVTEVTSPCPNDGVELERVSWRDYFEGLKVLEDQRRDAETTARNELVYCLELCRSAMEHHEEVSGELGPEFGHQNLYRFSSLAIRTLAKHSATGQPQDYWDAVQAFLLANDPRPEMREGPAEPYVKNGAELIAEERERQIEEEDWTADHDDEHSEEQLAKAAGCYLSTSVVQVEKGLKVLPPCFLHKDWPWNAASFKPSNYPNRNLVKAGALIAAEIDRLKRLESMEVVTVEPLES